MIVAARLLRDRRRSTLWWIGGLLGLVLFTVAFYPSIKDQASFDQVIADLPEGLKALIGYEGGVPLTSPPGYLHARLFATLAPLVVLVFGIGAGAQAIGGSEDAGTLEPLLANPVTRDRVATERYLAVVGLLVVLVAALTVALLAFGPAFGVLDGVALTGLLGACAGVFGIALLHASLAFAVGAAIGRRGPAVAVATAVAVAGYLVQSLLTLTDAVAPLRAVTPWHWYLDHNMLAEGPAVAAIVLPIVVSVPVFLAGWVAFRRRDLHN
jgi:ABC-2 type transport system permease protein